MRPSEHDHGESEDSRFVPAAARRGPLGPSGCYHGDTMSPVPCPSCGHPVTPEQKFCAECGTRLTGAAVAPSPPEDERRLVTMLFADLVGSTALGDSLDPDALYELTRRVHHQLDEIVQRYEGHIARHLGDGLLVLFGAPVAHENDAERAVLAALAMQNEVGRLNAEGHGPALGMRIGITSGEVVAGHFTGIYDVIGDAPNVAARLQGAGTVGSVLVGGETMRLARRRIRFGEKLELTLKGKAEPVAAYAVLGVREQVGERWDGGEHAGYAIPLIGRDRELKVMVAAWTRAVAGKGQLLTVVGEPGVGKSRLLAEGIERFGGEGARSHRLLRGRCLSYGQSVSLWLIADLVRSLCSVPEDAGIETVRERVATRAADALVASDGTDQAIARDVLGEVLGLPPGDSLVAQAGPQVRRGALTRILGLVLSALAETGTLLMVLEDLHWLDTASTEILEALLAEVPDYRMLVLATQRPEWTAPWTSWSWAEQMTLRPLEEQDAAALARAVLGDRPLSTELEVHLRERAEGNPFFVEELVRYLQEIGGLEHHDGQLRLRPEVAKRLPATLTELLLARLDRLESGVRTVAQVGSVIGRSFAVRLLARVMEREEVLLSDPLRSLQEADITYPQLEGELQHVFRHVLLRDAAYSMLVRRRQRQLHLAVGRAIAALYPTDEYVELIAYHLAHTEEDREAAEWLEKAGDRARATYAHEAAIEHYRGALDRLERSGGDLVSRARMEVELGRAFGQMTRYDEAHKVLERAIQRYQEAGEPEGVVRATAALGIILNQRGEVEDARRRLEETAVLLRDQAPPLATSRLYEALAIAFQFQGRYREMLAAAERSAELGRAVGDAWQRGAGEERRGTALTILGKLEEGREALEEAIALLEDAGNLRDLVTAVGNLAYNRHLAGELSEAIRLDQRTIELAGRTGTPHAAAAGHLSLAQLAMATGEWRQAREQLAHAEAIIAAQRRTAAWVAGFLAIGQGELALQEGDWAAARAVLDRAVEMAIGVNQEVLEQEVLELAQALLAGLAILEGSPHDAAERLSGLVDQEGSNLPWLLSTLAWAYLETGDAQRGLELAERAVREARERQALFYLPEALRIKGMALARLGRMGEARKVLVEGRERAAAMPNPYTEARILVELGLLEEQDGVSPRANAQLQEALAIFRRLGALKDIERTQRALAEPDRSADLTH
jgi:class 3 adenylate cyclase/tetratricopeptide (TPR) repeat protein